MKNFFIPVMLFLLSASGFAQNDDSTTIKKIVDETMTHGNAYNNLRKLCKQVGARLSGSPQYARAVTLVSQMMKDAGADTMYVQACQVPHWIRGEKEKGQIISGGKTYDLKLCALGNSVGTGDKGITANVIEVRSMAELNQLGASGLKGKIVFFNFPMNPTYINTFRAYGESGVSRTRGPSLAGRYGAIGAIVRSLSSNLTDYPHTGVTVYNDSFPKIPAVAISTNDAEYLSSEIKKRNPVMAYFRTTCNMLPDNTGYNVIGEIRGSQFPREIITVGGHLDSWDLAEGANDDGSGVVQGIEVLRTLKASGVKPKRTIRAVAFANEENGGRGGEKYLSEAKAKNEKHIFALESDEGGFTPRGFSLEMNEAQLNKILHWKNLFYPYGIYNIGPGGSGSDVGPLKNIGTALAGLNPDSERYFDIHHAATDVFENVSERELHLGAANMAALIWLVSEYGM
ncbi:MAG: M20/M25/M40 family metallo-hydrolase [Chitinophagaceae bacterium]|nr:M20/M25/M40 family metallo-hydrolase [Chitinophagaceae bacterium]